ncbi:hypothetical protein CcaCcLH18_02808 [Colletotrichum camelliae]|nr:hypothetical protein CcaCcLH18_02808 [Colletotrichum camelliae]
MGVSVLSANYMHRWDLNPLRVGQRMVPQKDLDTLGCSLPNVRVPAFLADIFTCSGGTLLLVELTGTMTRVPLIFGTFVNDNRNWGPMLTEQGWQTRLQQQGFTGLDMVFRDHATMDYSVSLMISRALSLPIEDLPQDILAIKPVKMDDSDDGYRFIEVSEPFMDTISRADFDALRHLILTAKSTLWLTKGAAMDSEMPEYNLLPGLSRTFRGEVPSIQLTLLDLDPSGATDLKGAEESVLRILRSSTNASKMERSDWEYALRSGKVYVSRLEPDKQINDMLERMIDTFQFVDDQEYAKPLSDDFVEMSVKAVGMNFHDVMISMGQIADTDLGVECSGAVTRVGKAVKKYQAGDEVITFRLGCYRTSPRNPEDMYQKMPENISFEAAATIPCIWTTIYYSIYDMARLQAKESILIHAAAGGLGQAAIILAQHIGAEIYVTVSSQTKKQFFMDKYGIPEDHTFNSRDLSFADGIKRVTNGRGVDIVINSLAGEGLRQTWLCVAPFGRFIEVGKRDIVGNTGLDMSPFMHNIVFAGVNMLSIYRSNIPLFARIISEVMKLLGEGDIRPIDPLTVMYYSQIEEAFRIMQTGKHIGKMVLKAGYNDLVPGTTSYDSDYFQIVPQRIRPFYLRPDVTYLLPGGLGGLGRSISSWMVDHGARSNLQLAERVEILTYLKSGAMIGVREKELLATIQAAMADELPIQSVVGLFTGGLLKQNGHDEPYWFADGRFAHLRIYDTQSFAVVSEDTTAELQAALAAATSLTEASELVCGALMRKLAKAMLIEIEDLDKSRPANACGVDSLVAVEVRAWVFKDAKSDVGVIDILSNAPVSQLAENIAAKSQLVSANVRNLENIKDL